MSLSVKKIKKSEITYDSKTQEHFTYCLEGSLPTWDGDTIAVNIAIQSKRRLEIEEDTLLDLKITGRQEQLITSDNEEKKEKPKKKETGKQETLDPKEKETKKKKHKGTKK